MKGSWLNSVFASENPRMDWALFSQLAVATVDGTTYYMMNLYEEQTDGHKAWNALFDWFDRSQIWNKILESLQQKLDTLMLYNGTTIS